MGVPTVLLPGFSREMVRVEDYRAYLEAHKYQDDLQG